LKGRSDNLTSHTDRPDFPHFLSNLAAALGQFGRHDQAIDHVRRAIELQRDLPEAHNNLGVSLEKLGRLDEAVAAYREAIRLRPNYAECHNNLGHALLKLGFAAEAVERHRKSIALRPEHPAGYRSLAAALLEMGRAGEALDVYRRVVDRWPSLHQPHSDLLFTMHNVEGISRRELFEEHVRWTRRHAEPLTAVAAPHENDRSPGRRLRVGYVSAHFRYHPVARFFEPILAAHDRDRFDVVCYSDVSEPDAATQRLRGYGHRWREVAERSDEQLADLVRQDRINILVDLTGHMGRHRLLAFARRPAPVQVTYLGYPNTTGMSAMNYRLTDGRHDPEGESDAYHTERLVRLDPCCWCYRPDERAPAVNEAPAVGAGCVTFAALNRLAKVTPGTIRLWARILGAVPGSRLMVLAGRVRAIEPWLERLFEENGLSMDRLIPVSRRGEGEYLGLYHHVDIALDTFPYNGHTTTCDALWMGVPTVTLAGDSHVSRAGLDVLRCVGLEDLVVFWPEQYVQEAIALAGDIARLRVLRRSLRDRMKQSPLLDGISLTRRIEAAYVRMWQVWCRGGSADLIDDRI
jgi:predicted O-linked N-acetylglucosamine transferase (SPINDLY family)